MLGLLSLPPRLLEKIEPEPNAGCWLWSGSLRSGYGQVNRNSWPSPRPAHRVVYELTVGPIPDGLVLDHLCRVRSCCNPSHLRVVTHRENLLALGSQSPAKTNSDKRACHRGHTLVDAYLSKTNMRHCRQCHADRERHYYHARRDGG